MGLLGGLTGGDNKSFFTGLMQGLSGAMQQMLAKRADEDSRTQAQEAAVLNHLATTSNDPEIRAMALSGLMELSQGKKHGGILGLGKLKTTPSFQKLMELGQRAQQAGLMGGGEGRGQGGPPQPGGAAPTATPSPSPSALPISYDEEAPSGGVLSAALPTTSPTAGGPPPAPSAFGLSRAAGAGGGGASVPGAVPISPVAATPSGGPPSAGVTPPTTAIPGLPEASFDPSQDPTSLPAARPDIFGTLSPVGEKAAAAKIAGMDDKQAEQYRRQYLLNVQREAASQRQAEAKAREQEARDAARQAARDTETDLKIEAAQRRTETLVTGMSSRQDRAQAEADARLKQRDRDRAEQRLNDSLKTIDRDLSRPLSDPRHIDRTTAYNLQADAHEAFMREVGGPHQEVGTAADAGATQRKPAPAGAAPPALSAPSPVPSPPAAVTKSAGPPPPPTGVVPNWPAIVSQAESLRRAGKSPQQIFELAKGRLGSAQLLQLKVYLRLQ